MINDKAETPAFNINMYIANFYEESELMPEATVKKYLTVRTEVKRLLDCYSLDLENQITNLTKK